MSIPKNYRLTMRVDEQPTVEAAARQRAVRPRFSNWSFWPFWSFWSFWSLVQEVSLTKAEVRAILLSPAVLAVVLSLTTKGGIQ
ncbi:MAG: hypothetical protein C5B49_07970 [Bdellovibrio sp.]|nr:MAG: hypothetical protein C5B49_07970 [Bdellovibrio sp.]